MRAHPHPRDTGGRGSSRRAGAEQPPDTRTVRTADLYTVDEHRDFGTCGDGPSARTVVLGATRKSGLDA